jgi:hypothetical protein
LLLSSSSSNIARLTDKRDQAFLSKLCNAVMKGGCKTPPFLFMFPLLNKKNFDMKKLFFAL